MDQTDIDYRCQITGRFKKRPPWSPPLFTSFTGRMAIQSRWSKVELSDKPKNVYDRKWRAGKRHIEESIEATRQQTRRYFEPSKPRKRKVDWSGMSK